MDLGGINSALIGIIAIALLGLALLYSVFKTRSRGKQDSSPTIERETRERYAEEERERKKHPEDDD